MGSKKTRGRCDQVYAASATWVESALRAQDSLFTPGVSIWSTDNLQELRKRFLDRPNHGTGNFYEKLQQQLEDSPGRVYQLMAELLYVHFLIVWHTGMKGATKKEQVERVLSWGAPVRIVPEQLAAGLEQGIASSQALLMYRPYQVAFIIEFTEHWNDLPSAQREMLLGDPWAFKEFAANLTFRGQLLKEAPNTCGAQREAMLHLVHPDTFEGTVSVEQKQTIASASSFVRFLTGETQDVDRKLDQIRRGLERELGQDFDFYDRAEDGNDIRARWDSQVDPWDGLVRQARAYIDSGELEPSELDYKVEMAHDLSLARDAVLAENPDWGELLKTALRSRQGHPIAWQLLDDFNRWCATQATGALTALTSLWDGHTTSVTELIRAFTGLLPETALRGAVGNATNVISVLLMALDVEDYPPFRVTLFNQAYDRVRYPRPDSGADEAEVYEHALGFLDRFIEEAGARGVELRHRLDAQSVIWQLSGLGDPEPEDPPAPSDLAELANKVYLTSDFLSEIEALLFDKKQVIFQGPPGTGKTYVAQELALHLAGSAKRVHLVQLHPSYAYEDFVQGFRPAMRAGQPGFALVDGPLLSAAKQAEAAPEEKHFLVIDEINRGNVAKVFGELYFLLEYRDKTIRLQYQADADDVFSLPANLYFIGTMNTADRSIALVDLALRRRFYFVDFHPDEEPVKNVLRGWIRKRAPNMEWVADVVDLANQGLQDDRHAAIGPSYFMKEGLDNQMVRRIWRHSVLPYVGERFFGDLERLGEFDLDKLSRSLSSPPDSAGEDSQASVVDFTDHGDSNGS